MYALAGKTLRFSFLTQTLLSFCASNFFLLRIGNAAYAAKDFDEAIKQYTAAIALDCKNCVYFSNRR